MEVLESIEVEVAFVNACSDGVIEIRIKEGSRIDLPKIEAVLQAQLKLTPKMAGVLVDARGTLSMSRKAQHATANNPVNDRTAATAILVANPVSAFLGNFFIRFAKPPYPAQLFRDETKARQWVLQHLEKSRER